MSPTPSGSSVSMGRRPGLPCSLCKAAGIDFLVRMRTTPLWLVLRAVHFDAFAAGTKTTEYRRLGGPYGKLERLPAGRPVTLSRGYSGPRLHMRIVSVSVLPASSVPPAAKIFGKDAQLVAIKLAPAEAASARPLEGPARRHPRQN